MRKQATRRSSTRARGIPKKWQHMFRYIAPREQALKELVEFVRIVHIQAARSTYSPESIRDNRGGKIYL